MKQNIIAYSFKTKIYIRIGISQNLYSKAMQIFIAYLIIFFTFFLVMLRAVKFYCKSCRAAIKIKNVFADCSLPHKDFRRTLQKIIPKVSFLFCHVLSELSCKFSIFGIV